MQRFIYFSLAQLLNLSSKHKLEFHSYFSIAKFLLRLYLHWFVILLYFYYLFLKRRYPLINKQINKKVRIYLKYSYKDNFQ